MLDQERNFFLVQYKEQRKQECLEKDEGEYEKRSDKKTTERVRKPYESINTRSAQHQEKQTCGKQDGHSPREPVYDGTLADRP